MRKQKETINYISMNQEVLESGSNKKKHKKDKKKRNEILKKYL